MKKVIFLLLVIISGFQVLAQPVNIDSVRVNNCIPYMINKNELIKSNILIDSIVKTPSIMDAITADSLIFIGNTYLVYYKKDQICMLSSIVFDHKITDIQFNGNTISAKTTFEDLKRIFPDDCKETRPIHIYGDVNQYQACDVGVADDQGNMWDMKILFFFLNNQLKRIDFWVPT